ncbi:neprilysin-1 [Drosophila eugracilis]|uniref:neprilysin-1 n=1 Tax=Drosophila eugracilis TaxID=29029 RepID=UPI0007E794CC|nr:neprilysin-1 [Drosophila eugracilis]
MLSIVLAILLMAVIACGQDSQTRENDLLTFSYKLEQYLDTSKQPCQDFYGYVCSRSANLSQTGRERLQSLLKEVEVAQLMDMELQLVNFFKSCENGRGIEALKASQLFRLSGGWPVLDANKVNASQRSNQAQSWTAILGYFHEVGAPYFFEAVVTIQSNKRLVVLQPDSTHRNTLRKFEQRVSEVLQSFGIEQSRAHVTALEVLSLERSRRDIVNAEHIKDQVEFSYGNFKRIAFENSTSAKVDWDGYFRKLLGGKTPQASDTIVVKELPRLIEYIGLLQNTSMIRLLNWIWTDYLMDIVDADCHQLAETYAGDVYAHVKQRVTVNRPELAQMYSTLGKAYVNQLVGSVWIDEISQQSSKQFLGTVMHLTLNGDERLNAAYHEILLGRRSLYRNLEKLRKFQRLKHPPSQSNQQVRRYGQVFSAVSALLGQSHLSTPLNYLLLGEFFSRSLVAAGSSSRTPGAWRGSDSEWRFSNFQSCVAVKESANDVLLGLLSQRQALSEYQQWLSTRKTFHEKMDELLSAGRTKMTLLKLFFVGSLLVDCHPELDISEQDYKRQVTHAKLRNSKEFGEAFQCRPGESLYLQHHLCNPF